MKDTSARACHFFFSFSSSFPFSFLACACDGCALRLWLVVEMRAYATGPVMPAPIACGSSTSAAHVCVIVPRLLG